jgi:hypothetical protein
MRTYKDIGSATLTADGNSSLTLPYGYYPITLQISAGGANSVVRVEASLDGVSFWNVSQAGDYTITANTTKAVTLTDVVGYLKVTKVSGSAVRVVIAGLGGI